MNEYEFQCRHDEHCSQPGLYWRMRNYTEIMDAHGNVIERVDDREVRISDIPACCTECGNEAWLRKIKPFEIRRTAAGPVAVQKALL